MEQVHIGPIRARVLQDIPSHQLRAEVLLQRSLGFREDVCSEHMTISDTEALQCPQESLQAGAPRAHSQRPPSFANLRGQPACTGFALFLATPSRLFPRNRSSRPAMHSSLLLGSNRGRAAMPGGPKGTPGLLWREVKHDKDRRRRRATQDKAPEAVLGNTIIRLKQNDHTMSYYH